MMMPTKLQRKILWEMKKAGGKGIIQTGHKATEFIGVEKTTRAIVINCSECVLWGLKSNHFIEKQTASYTDPSPVHRTWLLRPEGIVAAGNKEPKIRQHYTGGKHGLRWI